MRGSVDMNFLFTLGEVQRLVRAYADKQAARYGITRAQWAVLAKVERNEGMKQTELAEQMEMQPITLTRLIDKLCDNGWIERRGDETDRRVNRLYLKKAARPLLGKLAGLRSELTATALEGINPADAHRLLDATGSHQGKRSQRDPESGERTSAKGTALWLIRSSNSRPSRRATRRSGQNSPPSRAAALMAGMRRYRRVLLLVVLPLVALVAGVTFYLNGGRYVTTDDAYVGAQKVLITPDVSGKIISVAVKEGQQVNDRRHPVPDRSRCRSGWRWRRRAPNSRTPRPATPTWSPTSNSTRRRSNSCSAGIALKQRDVERKIVAGRRAMSARSSISTMPPTDLVTAQAQRQLRHAAALERAHPAARRPRSAARAVPGPHAGQGRARRRPTQPRSHHGAGADERHRHPGRADPARPLRHRRHAGVLGDRRRQPLGRRQSEGKRLHLCRGRPEASRSRSTPSPTTSSRARSARSRPAPARNSRSCRRRTPPAISSRWCSACRCGSISTRTTSSSAS